MLSPGQLLDDRYEILALLAEGGMGAVYRARRTLLGDEVGDIRIVRGEHGGSGSRDRFFRESRASARLRHPYIVSILDFNVDDEDHPFLVMELLNGPSLKDEVASKGRMTLAEVQAIVPSLCTALQFAHDLGIVHRDLKPANIVAHEFSPGQRVYKIVDFGLANLRDTEETRLTGPHEFLGTIAYASPEQLTGAAVDSRSDVYSLGAVVYEMLTGRVPFGGPDAMAMLTAHLSGAVPRVSETIADVPAWVDIAVSRALAKDPADRWATIADFGHALLAGDGGSTTTIHTAPSPGGLMSTYDLGERSGADDSTAWSTRARIGRSDTRSPSACCGVTRSATGKARARDSCARRSRCRWRIRRSSRCATTARNRTSCIWSPTTSMVRACAK